jgi:hypothetical protein
MSNVDEMIILNAKEELAWKKWEETRDIKYMNTLMNIINKRADLIGLRKKKFTSELREMDNKPK